MSSDYHILCLNHDPALRVDPEYASPNDALEAAAHPANHERLAEHVNCDLLVGRYSASLIEIACPGGERCKPGYHRYDSDTWTKAGWLRLLYDAYAFDQDVSRFQLPACWTRDRVLRLRNELGIARGDGEGRVIRP